MTFWATAFKARSMATAHDDTEVAMRKDGKTIARIGPLVA